MQRTIHITLLLSLVYLSFQTYGQSDNFLFAKTTKEATYRSNMVALVTVIKSIEAKYGVSIGYRSGIIENVEVNPVKLDESIPVMTLLRRTLDGTPFNVRAVGVDFFVIYQDAKRKATAVPYGANKQDKVVRGQVFDEHGSGFEGVSVTVLGTPVSKATDAQGNFEISVPRGSDSLSFSFVGYKTLVLSVGTQRTLRITMEVESQTLDEVVLVGYSTQSRKTVTSAISTVKSAEIENLPVANTDQLLQGRASGVQVNSTSGVPGSGVTVRVRGASSITGSSDPLYVIDGIPMQSSNLSGLNLGGGTTNPMADINPADIESMEILKDASATAIYGARAANGVVLITTKRGRKEQATIGVGFYHGSQSMIKDPEPVTGTQFEQLMNEVDVNAGNTPRYEHPENAINTYWPGLIMRDGQIRNADLSLRGGSEKVQYMVSANNFYQEGVLKSMDFDRTTGRINLDYSPLRNDKLKMGTSILYSRSNRARQRNDDALAGGIGGVMFYPSNVPVYNEDGSYYKIPTVDHPLAVINDTYISMITNRVLGSAFAEYEFIPQLRLKSSFSIDYSNIADRLYDNTKTNNGSAVGGNANYVSTNNNNWIQENVLSYAFAVNKHHFNVLVGTSLQESTNEIVQAFGRGFPSDAFREISSAATQWSDSQGTSYGIASLFSRVTYDFSSKYLVTLNVRRDGSSRFGNNNRWGTFPSVGLGWVASDEAFLDSWNSLSLLKVRAGFGVTGNQGGIRDFQSLGLWEGGAYTDRAGIAPLQLANPDLKWESTRQLDIGLDAEFFGSRLGINFDYYHKYTVDLLLDVSVPRTSGYSVLTQNYGEMRNYGFEVGINGNLFERDHPFQWNVAFNISTNKNKIMKLAAPFNVYNRDLFRYEEGGQMYAFYLHPQIGVDPQTGEIQFEDVNGDGEFDVNNDRRIVGTANPDAFGGLTNTLNYKNFDLTAFFQYSYGNEQLNMTRFFLEHGGTRSTNYISTQLERWQQPGDRTMIPKMTSANYGSNLRPSRFMEDGSYLRLKNVSLGYRLPADFARRMGMSTARVYVSGQNIFTITNYSGLDPELTGTADEPLMLGVEFFSVPQPKIFLAGINVTF